MLLVAWEKGSLLLKRLYVRVAVLIISASGTILAGSNFEGEGLITADLGKLCVPQSAFVIVKPIEVTFIALGFDVAKFGGFDELLVLFILGTCHSFNCKGK